MNHRFLPNREKDPKPGITQNRQLVKGSDKKPPEEQNKKNMPSNWIYNDQRTEKMWEDLERYQKKRQIEKENNPFVKIDQSTSRIKYVIDKYEKEDQELFNKMTEYSFSEQNDPGDEETMFLDARLKLTGILDDHSENQQKQSALLAGLRYWLDGVKGGDMTKLPDFLKTEESSYNIDIQNVVEALEGISASKTEIGERATETFKAAFSILSRKLEEANQKISQQALEIKELQTPTDKRAARKSLSKPLQNTVNIEELVRERNRNAQLESQIKFLREQQQKLQPQQSANENDLTSPNETNLESVVQAELKVNTLEDTVKRLKEETKYLQQQIFKMKQDELANTKKMTSLENHKESLEKSLKNANDKLKLYENSGSVDMIKDDSKKQGVSKADYEKKLNDIKLQHIHEMEELKEMQSQKILAIMKDCDRKLEDNMRMLTDGLNSTDGGAILKNTVKMYTDQIDELRNTYEKKIEDSTKKGKESFQSIIERYESILKLKDEEMQRNKAEFQRAMQMLEKKNELDTQERINQEILNIRESTTKDFQNMWGELTQKISELKLRLKSVETERDTLRHICEENLIDTNEEGREEEDDLIESSDAMLNETMQQLKVIELEKKLEEKYTLLMQTQRTILEETKEWEVDAAKKNSSDEISQKVSEVRRRIADMTRRDILAPKGSIDPSVMQHFQNVLRMFEKDNVEINTANKGLMMPAEEVEFKMNAYREKLLQVLNENEMWKLTFSKLDTITDKTEMEILEALKKAIAEQSKEFSVLQAENENLRTQLMNLTNPPIDGAQQQQQKTSFIPLRQVNLPPSMKTERQYIFQVNPGSIRHFFTKSEKAPSIPDNFSEITCHCAECGECFLTKREEVLEFGVAEPFVACPKCRTRNHLFCIDNAIETGRFGELSKQIRDLQFELKLAKGNERLPNDLRNLNLKDKAVNLFLETSKNLVNQIKDSYEYNEKCKNVLLITEGIKALGASRDVDLLDNVIDSVKQGIIDDETTENVEKILENSSAYISNVSTFIPEDITIPAQTTSPPPPHSSPRDENDKTLPPLVIIEEPQEVETVQKSSKSTVKESGKRSSSRVSSVASGKQRSARIDKKVLLDLQKQVLAIKVSLQRIRDALLLNKDQTPKLIKSLTELVKNKIDRIHGTESEAAELKKMLTQSQNAETDLKLQLTKAINALEKLQLEKEEQEDKEKIMERLQQEHEIEVNKLHEELLSVHKKLNDAEKKKEFAEMSLKKIQSKPPPELSFEYYDLLDLNEQITQQQQQPAINEKPVENQQKDNKFQRQSSLRKITVPRTPRQAQQQTQKDLTIQQRYPLLVFDSNDASLVRDTTKPVPVVYVTNVQDAGIPPPLSPKKPPIVDAVYSDQRVISRTAQEKHKMSLQEHIQMQKTQNQVEALTKRIKSLEKTLEEKVKEIAEHRDKNHDLSANAIKQRNEMSKMAHDLTKERMLHASTVSRLSKALQLLEERNKTVEKYRRLNDQFSLIASIAASSRKSDDRNDILKVFSAFGQNQFLAQMERNEVRSLERWIQVRDEIVRKERENEIKRLDALCLILVEKGGHSEKQPLVQVTPIKN